VEEIDRIIINACVEGSNEFSRGGIIAVNMTQKVK
jgi:hypothetical protein